MLARSSKKYESLSFDDEDTNIDEKTISNWSVSPDQIMENNELKDILDAAIQKLPPDYRIVFLLRDVEGFSTEETGKMTDLGISAVKSRLHRARAFLRNELTKSF
jgi:RNA polymerase sigma-70 factor (ECF subfamily)